MAFQLMHSSSQDTPGAHNEKERPTTERHLSSNTLCLTI